MSQSAEVFLREVMFENAIPMVVQGGDDVGGSELCFGCVSSLGCGGGGHDAEGPGRWAVVKDAFSGAGGKKWLQDFKDGRD
jgi:hypothetical protein